MRIKIKIIDEFKKPIYKDWVETNEKDLDLAFNKIKRKFL